MGAKNSGILKAQLVGVKQQKRLLKRRLCDIDNAAESLGEERDQYWRMNNDVKAQLTTTTLELNEWKQRATDTLKTFSQWCATSIGAASSTAP